MWNDYKFFMDFTSHFLQKKFAFWELDRSEKYNMNFWNISAIYQCKHNTKRNTSYSMNEVYLFTTQKKSFRRDNKRFMLKVLLLITLKKILQIYMNLLWLILFKNLQFSELLMSCLWSFQNLWPELLCISAIKNSAVHFKFVKNIFILINVFLFLYSFSLFIWAKSS